MPEAKRRMKQEDADRLNRLGYEELAKVARMGRAGEYDETKARMELSKLLDEYARLIDRAQELETLNDSLLDELSTLGG